MGLGSIAVLVADSLMPPLRRPVSSVLLDAPCSGLGALRRHPEGKWLKGPEIIRQHSGLQEELLGALAPLVAEGGILVYSVCTFEPEETTEIIERWLERNRTWTVEDPAALIPEPSRRWVTGRGELLILPEPGGPDGFYAVRLRRAG
jgi:16S rRNA (cytosine967-C5)-methyltransferase